METGFACFELRSQASDVKGIMALPPDLFYDTP
jgi:hypothetical protein